jgi:ABC-type sugar transport system ATPase subunit
MIGHRAKVQKGTRENLFFEICTTTHAPGLPLLYRFSTTYSFISHNMQDVFAVADRVIVMRRGSKAGERKVSETNENEVVGLMVGAEYTQVIKQLHDVSEEVHITRHDESEKDLR